MTQAPLRVLLVEDNLADARFFQVSFKQALGPRHHLAHVSTLAEAIVYLAKGPVQVIVLDMHLPDGEGVELLQKITEAAPEAAVIVHSGQSDQFIAAEAIKLGAQDYLPKGRYDEELLRRVVHYAIERQQSLTALRTFVSIVSHELRTPLTSIRGSLGLVANGAAGTLSPTAHSMVEIAHRNADRLVRLINDLLDLGKMEAGKMTFEMSPQPLLPLIRQSLEAIEGLAHQMNVTLLFEAQSQALDVNVDADRFHQVMTNLLSNAVKFAPNESTVEIALAQDQGRVRISVKDHGPGIPDEYQRSLFQPFIQASASANPLQKGTGLGLSISKTIVERHGGHIGFESTPGQGATFYIELPTYRKPNASFRGPIPNVNRNRTHDRTPFAC